MSTNMTSQGSKQAGTLRDYVLLNLIKIFKFFDTELLTSDYALLGIDLSDLQTLQSCLFDDLNVSSSVPTLFLSEVVLTYVSPEK